jgi:hypothetical protein
VHDDSRRRLGEDRTDRVSWPAFAHFGAPDGLLTMALADTTVPTVGTKFNYRHWRPATAIREAETDGNPLTQPNPDWAPRAGSTGGPEPLG